VIPYSVHSYGVVQAYAMGVPLVGPSLQLLATWHSPFGLVNHKGPGNTPWRRTASLKRVPNDGYAWLTHDPHHWWSPPTGLWNHSLGTATHWLRNRTHSPPRSTPATAESAAAAKSTPPAESATRCLSTELAHDPNDGCYAASLEWLALSEPYTWPHVTTFDTIEQLLEISAALLADEARRRSISQRMKAFFRKEHARAVRHARSGMQQALQGAKIERSRVREG